MQILEKILERPDLTPNRIRLAYGIAVATDVLQFIAGPIGWAFADEILDVVAMFLMWRVLGFHPLLLPTFALEFVPVVDIIPTWTACVAAVVALRKKAPQAPEATGPVIDVTAKRVE